MSIKHLYPTSTPALNLNPKSSRVVDPRLACVRNSIGTYVDPVSGLVKTAPANVARVEKGGLLVEESRENYLPNSENWTAWNSFISGPGETMPTANKPAPDGSTNAVEITFSSTYAESQIFYASYGATTSSTLTVSVWARSVTGTTTFRLQLRGGSPTNNYSTNTFTATTEWQRFSDTLTAFTGQGDFRIVKDGTDIGPIQFWGAQLEQGSFPTSYIPTSGSTVQRLADQASITGTAFSNWYNQSEGTWFAEAKCPVSPNNQWIWALNPSGTGEDMLYRGSTDALRSLARYRGDVFDTNDAPSGQFNKAVLGYNLTSQASSYFNAVSGIYSSISGNTGTPTSLAFGLTPGSSVLNGHISRLAYHSTRASDTALQSLTL